MTILLHTHTYIYIHLERGSARPRKHQQIKQFAYTINSYDEGGFRNMSTKFFSNYQFGR